MSFFDLDPTQNENLIAQATQHPIQPGDLSAGFFEGAGTGIFNGLKSAYYRDVFNVQDAMKESDKAKKTLDTIESLKPDPMAVGLAGHFLFNAGDTLGTIYANLMGGNITPTLLATESGKSYAKSQEALHIREGIDQATAHSMAAIEGAGLGIGVVAPAAVPGSLLMRTTSGAAINTVIGASQRKMISSELESAGYKEMAKQYKTFDAGSVLADMAIGAFFGGISQHGGVAKGKNIPAPKPSDLSAALTLNQASHIETGTAPGLPITPEARDAHVESVNKALADLMGGEPVDVGSAASLVDFHESPGLTTSRNSIAGAIHTHLDMPTLEMNLANNVDRVPSQVPNAILGSASSIKIEGQYYPVRWALVDAGGLEATMSKADNQFRDRLRAASQAQVSKIANEPDFNLLNNSPIMDFGAPTLTNEGQIIGGNGRFAGVSKAYDQGTHAMYASNLSANLDKFGIDPNATAGMKKPVLVRIVEAKLDVQRAAMASNEGAGLRMSALEQAKVDSVRLGDINGLHIGENGDILSGPNYEYIRQWAMGMPDTERGTLVDKAGHLSVEGKNRLRNAILYKAYGDSPTLERLVESSDPGARNVAAALIKTAPAVAEAKAAIEAGTVYPLDISQDISAAVETLDRVRNQGQKVSDYLNQGEMFGSELSPEARKILQFMGENLRSPKAISEMITNFYDRLKAAGNPNQADMLSGGGPEKAALLDAAIKDTGKVMEPGMAELPFEGPIKEALIPKEETPGSPAQLGQEFMAFRVGTDSTLANANGGNAEGIADFMARAEDPFSSVNAAKGEALYVYGVTSQKPFGEYATYNNGQGTGSGIGRREKGSGAIWYSFSGDGYQHREIAKIPMKAVRKALNEAGYQNFDDAGSIKGGEIIRKLVDEQAAMPESGKKLMQRVNEDYPKLVKEYGKLEDSKGGRVLNTDTARELSPEYLANRNTSADVHEAASAFIKQLYAEKLAAPTPPGLEPRVLFTAGGTGAGKSTGLKLLGATVDKAEMIYDTNMNKFESADLKIKQALEAGRAVTILYTYREPVDALTNGALTRATHQEAKYGTGRTVPMPEHMKTHIGARETMDRLAAKYASNESVQIIAIDNSKGLGKADIVPLEQIPQIAHNGLGERLNEALQKEHTAGRISEGIYNSSRDTSQPQGMVTESRPGGAIQPEQRSGTPGQSGTGDAYSVSQLISEHPDLTIVNDAGETILASDALAQADAEIAMAQRDSQGYDAAVACALRG